MKRILFVLFLLLVFVALASAQNTSVTIGGSFWACSWDKIATQSGKDNGYSDEKLGSGSIFGPYLSVNSNRWNFGVNYLFGSFNPDDTQGWDEYTIKRNDINFTLGYRIIAQSSFSMNLFGGVKLLKMTYDLSGVIYDPSYGSFDASGTETDSAPMFGGGVSAVIPLGSAGLYTYGSLAYLTGTLKVDYKVDVNGEELVSDSYTNDYSTNLVAITAGLGYRFSGGVGISAGYRGDFFGSDATDLPFTDRLSGFIASVSYTIH